MQAKAILQTIGTISSIILALVTLRFTENILEINSLSMTNTLSFYIQMLLPVVTVIIMIITGLSYYKSRMEYEGLTRFLYIIVSLAHTVLAPLALLVGTMKIHFGQYWLVAIVGILVLIYWGSQHREQQN